MPTYDVARNTINAILKDHGRTRPLRRLLLMNLKTRAVEIAGITNHIAPRTTSFGTARPRAVRGSAACSSSSTASRLARWAEFPDTRSVPLQADPLYDRQEAALETRDARGRRQRAFRAFSRKPADVAIEKSLKRDLDLALLFATTQKELNAQWPKAPASVKQAGALWVSYPKKNSGIQTALGMGEWDATKGLPRARTLRKVGVRICARLELGGQRHLEQLKIGRAVSAGGFAIVGALLRRTFHPCR